MAQGLGSALLRFASIGTVYNGAASEYPNTVATGIILRSSVQHEFLLAV